MDINENEKSMRFSVYDRNAATNISKVCKALSVPDRVRIMTLLSSSPMNLYELSVNLAIPISSVSHHINILQDAGLIFTNFKPTPKGHARVCSKTVLATIITFEDVMPPQDTVTSVEMPIGLYSECRINAPCGLLSTTGRLGFADDPSTFYSPLRVQAELLWFGSGYISYRMPAPDPLKKLVGISFSFEICSEAAYYNPNWMSDITVHVNDREICTFTLPGDFGGRRGNYTPQFWPLDSTQFGQLKTVEITREGVIVDGARLPGGITLSDIDLYGGHCIKFALEIKDDATHKGGLNLFGKNFGDHPQAIIMTLHYEAQGNGPHV